MSIRIARSGLFAADEADAEGEGAALATGKSAEIGGVGVVDDNVGILTVERVDGFDADAPEVAAEAEFFLDAEVEAGVVGEARGVGRANELLLKIDDAEGEAGVVLEKVAELDAPDVRGRPTPRDEAIGVVPSERAGLLRDVEDIAERRIEDFVGVSDGASVGPVDFGVFGEHMADGECGGAVAIFARVFEKEDAAGLSGLLIDVSETVRAVAREKLKSEKSIVREFLLPRGTGGFEARLMEAAAWEKELADDGRTESDFTGGIEEGVELLLVESLREEGEIERSVVDAPAEGNF